MHQVILFTALTATGGLFGGGQSYCASGHCGGPAVSYYQARPAYYAPAYYAPAYQPYAYYPAAPAQGAPAVAQVPQPAPMAQMPSPAPVAQPVPNLAWGSYYYPMVSTCAGGNCARR